MTIYGDEQFLNEHFERTVGGWIAYKTFNMFYTAPAEWEIEVGNLIFADVETDQTYDCGYGINVGPNIEWLKRFVIHETVEEDQFGNVSAPVWKVLIPEGAEIVIPIGGQGKIRVDQIQILEEVDDLLYINHPQHPDYEECD